MTICRAGFDIDERKRLRYRSYMENTNTTPDGKTINGVRMMKHYIQNVQTGAKARVWYNRCELLVGPNGERGSFDCVTIYGKDCLENLSRVIGTGVQNDSDMRTDYFENDRFRVWPSSPMWARAVELATR